MQLQHSRTRESILAHLSSNADTCKYTCTFATIPEHNASISAHLLAYLQVYLPAYLNPCQHTCILVNTLAHMPAYLHNCSHAYRRTYTLVSVLTYLPAHVHTLYKHLLKIHRLNFVDIGLLDE